MKCFTHAATSCGSRDSRSEGRQSGPQVTVGCQRTEIAAIFAICDCDAHRAPQKSLAISETLHGGEIGLAPSASAPLVTVLRCDTCVDVFVSAFVALGVLVLMCSFFCCSF